MIEAQKSIGKDYEHSDLEVVSADAEMLIAAVNVCSKVLSDNNRFTQRHFTVNFKEVESDYYGLCGLT